MTCTGDNQSLCLFNSNMRSNRVQWLLDMRATDHMTPFKGHLSNYKPHKTLRKVLTTGGGRLQVNGIGNVFLSYGGVLKKVLHVPDLKAHLIFVKKLVSDNGWRFTIDSDSCLLTDKLLKKKIGFTK